MKNIIISILFIFCFLISGTAFSAESVKDTSVLYTGKIYHIFFHSLVIYPNLAFFSKKDDNQTYKDYMITRDEFEKILPELYKNNFVLIEINSLYKVNSDNSIEKQNLYLPVGKKPLIISLDDLNYYRTKKDRGMANKLVLDQNGNVATEIVTPDGKIEITRDGDIVPLLDDFVIAHPDFSIDGAKGIIALTGFDGVLGYRTSKIYAKNYSTEILGAQKVIEKLKSTGWSFASHSYSHRASFVAGTISLEELKKDTELWRDRVASLVGNTNIFIGPFGQVFRNKNDPRRIYLMSQGFKVFCGVGMDLYINYSSNYLDMNRADIDGYRLTHASFYLKDYFDPKLIVDYLR
ncbi:MAG: hypothetical protein NTZ44_00455 [Candidatus Nomurabacteria bacterium]|nr:hypothetical protein [Candidatus Nomurabacteria bacterium]